MADERAGRNLAFAAVILAITAFWLPWWLVRYSIGPTVYLQDQVHAFAPREPLSTVWPVYAASAAVVLAAILWFVGVAARSWENEPKAWRRNLWLGALFAWAGAGLTTLWPAGVDFFWDSIRFHDANGTAESSIVALPGLGWWCVVVAATLGTAAALRAWSFQRRDIQEMLSHVRPEGEDNGPRREPGLVLSERDYKLFTLFTKIIGIFTFAGGSIQLVDRGRPILGLVLIIVGIVVTMAPVPMSVVRPDVDGPADDSEE